MDTSFPIDSSYKENHFFRPEHIVSPIRRNLFTVKVRLIYDDLNDVSQSTHESVAITPHIHTRQRGAVLITGLIFLVVLTLLGTTALQGTVLEEKMAGNLRDETLAFQAAEAALRSGERFLEQVTLPEFNGVDGLYHYMCSSIVDPSAEEEEEESLTCPSTPDPVAEMDWNTVDSRDVDVAMEGVASQPRYFIEQLGNISLQGNSGSAQQSGTALDATMFRVVARGVGGTETATVLLQSTYRR
ncbi:hypothetical protein Nstercoris_02133 [Nitrosomonas stercoris]|uniref:Type 4 fimbrial biogenesis protein PilX N-terminal domain-containing protein n=1 Tax=Nitrosomonas stercoris TaxID=1444684 RepID=A0A4Y1YNW6_9PROT|nr:hypothetical protein Nstercoris_02133 [Nitrosomonas stercoris]